MSTKYEIGGHLVDANGWRHEIVQLDTYTTVTLARVAKHHTAATDWVDTAHYRYEPPPRILTLSEAIEAAKAGETVVSSGGEEAYWCRENHALKFCCSKVTVAIYEDIITGWRVCPKAKPLPKMTQEMANLLDALEDYHRSRSLDDPIIWQAQRVANIWFDMKAEAKGSK